MHWDIVLVGVYFDVVGKAEAVFNAGGNDAAALSGAPEKFEEQRGGYWNRREFSAFTVYGASAEAQRALAVLGFNIG